jgi:hypothetical protein
MTTFRIVLWVKVQINTRPENGPYLAALLNMMRKAVFGFIFAGFLTFGASAADIVVRVGPPRPVVERRIARPGPGYVWVNGYHRWDGRGYVWAPGRWELPPRRHARWVDHRWVHRRDGWVFVEGRWR